MIWYADIETTGLYHDLKRQESPTLWNFCAINEYGEVVLFERGKGLQAWLYEGHTLVMHNGICYDKPVLENIFHYDMPKNAIIDTLPLSWVFQQKRIKHGLEGYGEQFGVPKPEITDWENQNQDDYNHRVLEDCKIQKKTFEFLDLYADMVYGDEESKQKFYTYLMRKMEVLAIQQENPLELDIEGAEELFYNLAGLIKAKVKELEGVMPHVQVFKNKKRPAKPFKKDGSLSATGAAWKELCDTHSINFDSTEVHKIPDGLKPPNANSHTQIKDWLFSLGWIPETFKYVREEGGGERKIPQVGIGDGELCPSVEALFGIEPDLEHLKGLGILNHRKAMVAGFLRDQVGGTLTAYARGFTSTFRLRHGGLVNLPSGRVPYGEEIRGLLKAKAGSTLLGSDLSSLEDRCKHHFQMPYDPEYVEAQMSDDFDPHLMICEMANLLTAEQVAAHKSGEADYSDVRARGKGTNYSCQYGAQPPTVARTAGVPLAIGERLHAAYHKLNWSIKAISDDMLADNCKKVRGEKWQQNPVNGFWYPLRSDKDSFSALCQGLGSYVFDLWVFNMIDLSRSRFNTELPISAQFHDEVVIQIKDRQVAKDLVESLVLDAITQTNEQLRMNRDMACDIQFGSKYSEIH